MSTVRQLDALVQEHHLLKHPFYRAWSAGHLSQNTLRDYAEQYYHFENHFPQYVAGTYARLERAEDRRVMLENLIDEEGREVTHPQLWWQFARSMGAPRFPAAVTPPTPATRNLCRMYEGATLRGSAARGLGALYAYESQFAEIATEKSRGLSAFYGIRDPKAHEFFRVHEVADVEHGRAERQLLARAIRETPGAGAEAERGVRASLGSWWKFLDSFPTEC
ncbi:MAG: CADD family putative folate metabolism protein [Thermoplasmata archaeon]|nr:CADD family putative folate metabolism protein [Thermoplasmata archaeon]